MPDPKNPISNTDPRHGKNPGYAENQPRDRRDAQQPAQKPKPDSVEVKHDADAQPDPVKGFD